MTPTNAVEVLRTETLGETVAWLPGGSATYAQVASWAVWATETPGGTGWSRDQSVLAADGLAAVAHGRVVFVALNKGVNPAVKLDSDWANFHSGRSDYKLARAISYADPTRTVLWGAYLTDLFKGLPTPTAADLTRHLDELSASDRTRTVDAMVALFQRELEILGEPRPLLVGIGRTVQQWIARAMPEHDSVGITHYAAAIGREAYGRELEGVVTRSRAVAPRASW